jgi:hypothetical protein
MKIYATAFLTSCCAFALLSCVEKQRPEHSVAFTRLDSLTERYLAYQDTILRSWNLMINDDNEKIHAMLNLIHELKVSNPDDREKLSDFEDRVLQLKRMRYTEKSMVNPDVIEEYDFASTSLIRELISLAESKKEFAYNPILQKLVDQIRSADQRVTAYRLEYDTLVTLYNRFIERNEKLLKEIDLSSKPEKKPLFQMVSE